MMGRRGVGLMEEGRSVFWGYEGVVFWEGGGGSTWIELILEVACRDY